MNCHKLHKQLFKYYTSSYTMITEVIQAIQVLIAHVTLFRNSAGTFVNYTTVVLDKCTYSMQYLDN